MSVLPKFSWPVPSNKRGSDFANQDDVMSHLEGEPTGWYLLGSNGMWHGGIHITSTTTPWCALSGKAASESVDFPVAYKGEQAVRCMADGEVVAYRICSDYLDVPWETGPLNVSGSFVLVRHYIQSGEKKESGLHFYTLYMHLAPYSAYAPSEGETHWAVNDNLSAYRPEWVMSASTDNKEVSDSYRVATIPKGAHIEWDATDSNLHTIGHNGRRYGLVTFKGLSDKAKAKGTKTSLQEGQQYWILTDKNNLVPLSDAAPRPSWWTHLMPPFAELMQFDKVVCPTPYPISAGDSVGHLGYFQVPKDGGYDSRYQVHIECLSSDDSLPAFLKNPEKVGESTPLYLKCPSGLPLFSKDLKTKAMVSSGKVSQGESILTLSQVKTETDAQKQAYWFLPYANGYVPKTNKSVETLSQYDLEKRGFTTAEDEAPSFDHLDGKTPPKGLVQKVLDRLHYTSSNDARVTHRVVPLNYKRLLNRIDGSISPYSPHEYLSAIHNPSYRDAKNRMIVKHPSEWYHKKSDPIWLPFLNNLTKDAPEWKTYSEAYIEKMVWMQDASKLKLGPSLWHMHPIMFLGTLLQNQKDWRNLSRQEFVDAVYEAAQKDQATSGIPAAITTAQAIEESYYGKKVMVDINNERYSFNLFGIKAKAGQDYVENWTSEFINGRKIKIIDKFAAYSSFEESIADRARFLKENKRYASLFETDDPIKWAHGLQEKGYATNPTYAKNLIAIMKGSYMKSRGLK
ncbi:glycoside hydrolase family 73 protein [Hafnia alvei]|uniref:Mannosyl-glycoprotein endo-beta-N-acetylglucosaminidase n=1 Tax=Hafnia alvei TaxID=569 RepID=A0A1C6YXU7_HAFAL|nr:glucosaminidase domain-containing protein [Hafnia alvei]NLS55064.1 hypothetical protein [Hafnia alvei]SCM51702.1 Mannosyl-glycoprotein endo-beta-N-acetylglucosaminidase [Hafnia alvei]